MSRVTESCGKIANVKNFQVLKFRFFGLISMLNDENMLFPGNNFLYPSVAQQGKHIKTRLRNLINNNCMDMLEPCCMRLTKKKEMSAAWYTANTSIYIICLGSMHFLCMPLLSYQFFLVFVLVLDYYQTYY